MGWLANIIDNAATGLDLPEWGLSEVIGGGKTSNTGRIVYSGSGAGGGDGALQKLTGSQNSWLNGMTDGVISLAPVGTSQPTANNGGTSPYTADQVARANNVAPRRFSNSVWQ